MTLLVERRPLRAARLRHHPLRALPVSAFLVDLMIAVAAGGLAVTGRNRLSIFTHGRDVGDVISWVGPLMILGWLAAIWAAGGYRRDVFGAGTEEYKRVVNASLVTAGLVGIGCYLAKYPLSRGFFFLAFLLGVPALMLGRFVLRRALYQARRRGALVQRVIIAGTPSHVDEIAQVLGRETWLGYEVVGALVPQPESRQPRSVPVLGTPGELLDRLDESDAEVVFVAGGALDSSSELRRIAWELEDRDVQVIVAPSVTDVSAERVRVRPVGGLPLVHIDKPRTVEASRLGKRVFDIFGATCLLLLAMPLLAVAALWIKLHDRGPVLFMQERAGRDGKTFRCLKLRSMNVDAANRLEEMHAAAGYESGVEGLFKLEGDPRITRPGALLRRYSVDELPQLVNVLRGDMSLVGPRPPLPAEVAAYAADTGRRLRVRPGMTGLWQVSGRADLSIDEAIRLDLYYVDNWSMLQDLAILSRTVGAVLFHRGAY